MFAASKTDSVSGAAPDGQFNYVTMLLHGDGTNGGQNNTFLDSSTNNFTITRNGNTTQGSFSPYGSNWSNFFDGTGDYLSIADNAALDLSTLDFTIECWVFPTTGISDVDGVISKRSTSTFDGGDWRIAYSSANTAFGLAAGSNNTDRLTPTITLNAWNHIAFVRESGTLSCYANGTRGANLAWTTNLDNAQPLLIGLNVTGYDFPGYISNVRIVKGTAVYSGSTYTVPTTPLTAITNTSLLTCQSNRFIDNSASPLTITVNGTPSVQRFNPFGTSTAYSTSVIGGSGYFDGSGDYLTVADNAALDVDAGDFTMEAWVYFPDASVTSPVLAKGFGSAGGWMMWVQSTLRLRMYDAGGSSVTATSSASLTSNSWNHVAATRSGNTLTVYVNGVSSGTATFTGTSTNASVLEIGGYNSATALSTGYISNARLVKGTAVYTGNFTPSITPLTAISGTSLLTNFTNGAIYDNAMMNDLETVGNAQISTSVKKYGTGSLYFDGTGDYLLGASNPNMSFGAGDFTVEAWVYTQGTSGNNQTIFQKGRGGDSNLEFAMSLNGSNQLTCFYTTDGSTVVQPVASSNTVSLSTWTHVAISRSGSTWRCFVDGTLRGSDTYSATLYTGTGVISSGANPVGDNPYTGYIDDLRVTKGYARYTANFTPPTAALSDTGPY